MNKKTVGIIFPHQLFQDNPLFAYCDAFFLVEEYLFFKQYPFHRMKLAFHRASMKYYESFLRSKGYQVQYVESDQINSDIRNLPKTLKTEGIHKIYYIDTTDFWLEKRLVSSCGQHDIQFQKLNSPLFLNTPESLTQYFQGRKRMFQTDFYVHQRQSRGVLLQSDGKPVGGKWTFDAENRLKYPKGKTPPKTAFPALNQYYQEAFQYVKVNFPANYGQLNENFLYPCTHEEAQRWLKDFLQTRLQQFGDFEDSLVANENILHHSVLTPMLNVGLLTPEEVLQATLNHAEQHDIPINSIEGFIRQVMGWREFIRAVYQLKGTEERNRNYWGFTRKIPESFWTGTTGIPPLDHTIKKVLQTGYCHHIERLMVLGNFMLLCEFDPDEVYRWFMTLFIDAYDWVMVPNIYGMSQFADGGLMSTKPYISGSNYLMKMSDFPKGDWQEIWDALFWRFMHVHRDFFLQNPRLGMLIKTFDKMPEMKRNAHLKKAELYLRQLS